MAQPTYAIPFTVAPQPRAARYVMLTIEQSELLRGVVRLAQAVHTGEVQLPVDRPVVALADPTLLYKLATDPKRVLEEPGFVVRRLEPRNPCPRYTLVDGVLRPWREP